MSYKYKKYMKDYYQKNKEGINLRNKLWKEKNKEKQRGYYQKWKKNHKEQIKKEKKEKYYLHKLIVEKIIVDFYNNKSISGYSLEAKKIFARRLVRKIKISKDQLCEECNLNLAKEKHHEDYNYPLKVKLLCTECHLKCKD